MQENNNELEVLEYKDLINSTLSKQTKEKISNIAKIIQEKDKILIAAHANPDGDALGSSIALAYICEHLNKEYILYNETNPLPEYLAFLPSPKPFEHDLDKLPFRPELIVVLDCGDRNRIGLQGDKLLKIAPSINIDHHLDNPQFGSRENLTDTTMAAAANAIFCLALELDVPLSNEIAIALYTAFISDTGSFSFSNTNARILLSAAFLVHEGLEPNIVVSNLDNSWSHAKNKLWAFLMSTYIFDKELETGYVLISKALLEELECTSDDLEGFAEHLRKVKDIRIAFVLREKSALECKASFRSSNNDDVQKLSMYYNGGGHKNAAGATFKMPLAQARDAILQTIKEHKKEFLP